jgi:hypothetical protein
MRQLWVYEDYVERLSHANNLIRSWAFNAIRERFPRRYTREVAGLLEDPDEYVASAAVRYLARHKATEFAAAILKCLFSSQGNVPGNCATALGDMLYEPAADQILEFFPQCRDTNTFLGILHYLGKIHREDCHQALRAAFDHVQDHYWGDVAALCLLEHQDTSDVPLVLDRFFERVQPEGSGSLRRFLESVNGSILFEDFAGYRRKLLNNPKESITAVIRQNAMSEPEPGLLDELSKMIKNGHYEHLTTSLMFTAQKRLQSRVPEEQSAGYLSEVYAYDKMALAFLEEFSRRSSIFRKFRQEESLITDLVSALLACYFSIIGREACIPALASDASLDDLLTALRSAGSDFPEALQDRLVELAPISELKAVLSEGLLSWGDIWVVRLMGRIGNPAFVPDLVRVVRDTEGTSFIHEDAIRALNGIDPEGHEELLRVLHEGKITDDIDIPGLLEHLPYPESFDMAVQLWREDRVESLEMLGISLEGIGDVRGIKLLQEVYAETEADYIGESLETLCLIYNRDIPELPAIRKQRKEYQERRQRRWQELNKLADKANKKGLPSHFTAKAPITILPRSVHKIGRNQPCPCGSGKKHKKCCLLKQQ